MPARGPVPWLASSRAIMAANAMHQPKSRLWVHAGRCGEPLGAGLVLDMALFLQGLQFPSEHLLDVLDLAILQVALAL
jgi:hypothetical protein